MRPTALACLAITLSLCVKAAAGKDPQLPPGASLYRQELVAFSPSVGTVRVVFYKMDWASVGVEVVSAAGKVIAQAGINAPCRFMDGTGVYNVIGGTSKQIVMYCQVGADSTWAQIYSFERGGLVKIGEWSGFSFSVLRLRRQPVVVYQLCNMITACLPDLYAWRGGAFVKANSDFPEFYRDAIETERSFIEGRERYSAALFAQTCNLAARALLYGRSYDQARSLCDEALSVVKSGTRVVPENTQDLPDQAKAKRSTAEKQIGRIIDEIETARRSGSLNLGQ